MKKLLVLALLAGCSSAMKHETVTLQCLGFCAYTDINHYSKESKK